MPDYDTANVLFDHPTSKPIQVATGVLLADAPTKTATLAAPESDEAAVRDTGVKSDQPEPNDAESTEVDRSAADALFDGGTPMTESEANTLIGERFDAWQAEARTNMDADYVALLNESRAATAATFAEDAIGTPLARELSSSFGEWQHRDALDDDALQASADATMRSLRGRWGPLFEKNLTETRAYLAKVEQRLPYLAEYIDRGLGNSEKFILSLHKASRSAARAALKRGRA